LTTPQVVGENSNVKAEPLLFERQVITSTSMQRAVRVDFTLTKAA